MILIKVSAYGKAAPKYSIFFSRQLNTSGRNGNQRIQEDSVHGDISKFQSIFFSLDVFKILFMFDSRTHQNLHFLGRPSSHLLSVHVMYVNTFLYIVVNYFSFEDLSAHALLYAALIF